MVLSDIQQRIIEASIDLFKESGLKFTMDEVASALGISKKTIYAVFKSKEEILNCMVDYCFDSIKDAEQQIMNDSRLSTIEKLGRILGVMPDRYQNIDLQQLYSLKSRYPVIYDHVSSRLESDWDMTIRLLKQGMMEGSIRMISIPVFKCMFEASVEQFFQKDVLVENNMTYTEGLQAVVDILLDGIIINKAAGSSQSKEPYIQNEW